MKIQELRKKNKQEISQLLKDLRGKLQQMRFDLSGGKLKNLREIREIKKDIARILTISHIWQKNN